MDRGSLSEMAPGKFKDVSQTELAAGDYLIIDDRTKGERYAFEVVERLRDDEDEPHIHAYKMLVVESTSPNIKTGSVLKRVQIDRRVQTWGQVLRRDDASARMSAVDLDDFCIIELRKYLDRQEFSKARFKDCVEFLVRMRALPGDGGTALGSPNYKFVQRLCKRFEKFAYSKGGWIRSTGAYLQIAEHELGGGAGGRQVITIDFPKLVLGLRFLLESMDNVRLKNAE